jgi:WD40 repeat protein
MKTGAKRREIPMSERVRDMAFSPDGRLLVTSDWDNSQVCVRETATGQAVGRWEVTYPWNGPGADSPQWIDALAVSPDGRTVVTAGSPKGPKTPAVLQMWDVDTGEQLRSICIDGNCSVSALAFSRDADRIEERVRSSGGPVLQGLRALEVLERVGTPETRKIMEKIAESDGPLADEAKASLRR